MGYSACAGITTGLFTSVGIDQSSVYYFDEKGVGLKLFQKDKTTAASVTREISAGIGIPAPYARFVVDGCGLYWGSSGSIWRLLPTDTRARRISWAPTVSSSRRLAVDDTHVYWTDVGFIGRIAK